LSIFNIKYIKNIITLFYIVLYKSIEMSYYKNNVALSTIIKYITNSTITNYYKNTGIAQSYSYVSDFTSSINEKPTSTTYTFTSSNTDISTYSIAYWIDSTQTLTIPAWSSSIRAILIGSGGTGGSGQGNRVYQQQDFHSHQQDYHHNDGFGHHNNHPYNQQDSQQHTYTPGTGGGGGGGGGFLYITSQITGQTTPSSQYQQYQIQAQAQTSGSNTQLSIQQTAYVAFTGGTAQGQNVGSGGQTNGTGTINSAGYNGSTPQSSTGGNGGKNGGYQTYVSSSSTLNSYGVGGAGGQGGSSTSTSQSGQSGQSGGNGYYRIYFLTS
jgi:hypothetical protein